MTEGYSLADIGAVAGCNNRGGFGYGDGGYGWMMLVILFAIFGGWGGGWGNRSACGEGAPVTEAALCNSMNFNNLENAVGRLNDTLQAGQRQTDNAVCQLGYQSAQLANQTQRDLCQGFSAVNAALNAGFAQQAQCCCETQRAIDGVNYNNAINTRDIIESQQAGTQRILDFLCNQETQHLRDENLRCYINSQVRDVVRYPTTFSYNAGASPFCGCNGFDNRCCC